MTSDSPYFAAPIHDLRGKVLKGAAWMTGMHVGQKIVDLILLAVMARILSPYEFGVVAACYIFIDLTKLFIEIGVGAAIIQLPDLTRRDVRTACTIVAITAVVFFCATQLAAPLVAALFSIGEVENALRALAFLYLAQAIGIVPESLLIKQLRARDVMAAQMAAKFIGSGIVGVTCALNGFSYWSLVAGSLVDASVRAAIVFMIERPPISPSLQPVSARRLLTRGAGFSASRILNFAALQGDYIIAGRVLGAGGLGVYSRAYRLMSLPADLYAQIAERLVFPAFAFAQTDPGRANRAYLAAVSLTAVIGGPLSIGLCIFGADIIRTVLGAGWSGVIGPFAILSAVSYFRLGAKASGSFLRAAASLQPLIAVQALYAACVIGLGIVAAPYGATYLALSTSVSALIFFVAISVAALRKGRISIMAFLNAHISGVLTTLLFGALGAAIAVLMHAQSAPSLYTLLAGGAGYALLSAALLLFGPRFLLGESGYALARSFRTKLSARLDRKSVRHESS